MYIKDPNSDQMISLIKDLPLNIDTSLPRPFQVLYADTSLLSEVGITSFSQKDCQCPEAWPSGVFTFPMPVSPEDVEKFIQTADDSHAFVQVNGYSYTGSSYNSDIIKVAEFEQPRLINPKQWRVSSASIYYPNKKLYHPFLTPGASGSGLSFFGRTLAVEDFIYGNLTHECIFTIPPQFLAFDYKSAYCTGEATLPLAGSYNSGRKDHLAFGTGLRLVLSSNSITITTPVSTFAKRIIYGWINYGIILNDQSKEQAIAISAYADVFWESQMGIDLIKELREIIKSSLWFVANTHPRWGWYTQNKQDYPNFE